MNTIIALLEAEDRLLEAICDDARRSPARVRVVLLRTRCHTLSRLIAAHLALSLKAEKPNVDAFGSSMSATPNSREGER